MVARSATQRRRVPGRRTSGLLARWRSDAEFFEAVRKQMIGRPGFQGAYVAVLDGQIVGTDRDELSLFKAVTETYGDVPLFIGRIERQPRVRRIPGALRSA